MSNFDESLFSIQAEATYGDFLDFDENGDPIRLDPNKYALSDLDELCFTCPLPDCKENSNKCPIKIVKARSGVCGGCSIVPCETNNDNCAVNVSFKKAGYYSNITIK